MQTQNVNPPIVTTARHGEVSDDIREYAHKKISGLHLDYPKIIEAKVIFDTQNYRKYVEILLMCANHIHIEASTETDDMKAAIDETVSKIARRMRKFKTRLLKKHRARNETIKHLEEAVFPTEILETEKEEIEPVIVHKENYKVRPLFQDEAIMDLELSDRDFLVFKNAGTDCLAVVFKRKDGDYGMIEPKLD
ncbi:MAG: ribosome-associated translation inhibitor RaiA [Verrucomicrobiota bacterium]